METERYQELRCGAVAVAADAAPAAAPAAAATPAATGVFKNKMMPVRETGL